MDIAQIQTKAVQFLANMAKSPELALPVMIIVIITMFVIPVPAALINMLVAISLTVAILTILVTMHANEPLQFSSFPSVILFSTVFRLALNITTTRAILLNAHQDEEAAGAIITTFGTFVTGNNYVVGIIIFLIIVIVNFMVITHGAQRIGEVAARFTLDAMPGKQMSIDADLNNGLITDQQARDRRKTIEREADYFGAMDGASRFVQREALAGLIIVAINIIGGFILGVAIYKMNWLEAVQRYTVLTIGDGLAAAIPSLLISTATGVMVTNAASGANLSTEIFNQMLGQKRVLSIAAGVMGAFTVFSLFSGSFGLVFSLLIITLILGGFALAFDKLGLGQKESAAGRPAAASGRPGSGMSGGPAPSAGTQQGHPPSAPYASPEAVSALLYVDPMELEIGYGLIPLVDPDQKGDLLDRVTMIRRQTALEMGIIVPPIRIRDNIQLRPNDYSIKIKGVEVAGGSLMVDHFLAMNPGGATQEIEGVNTTEPAFGLPAKWIREGGKEQAELLGYTVVDPASVVATHLTEVIKSHAYELLGRQETQELVNIVKEKHSVVVEELIPNKMELGDIQKVLQNLLRERVSIRNLALILEALADYGTLSKDVNVLTEYVRAALARQICKQHQMNDGTLPVITIDPKLEDLVLQSVHDAGTMSYPVLPPEVIDKLTENMSKMVEKTVQLNYQPIIMCSPRVRMYVRRLIERLFPSLTVLSHSEISSDCKVRSLGMVGV